MSSSASAGDTGASAGGPVIVDVDDANANGREVAADDEVSPGTGNAGSSCKAKTKRKAWPGQRWAEHVYHTVYLQTAVAVLIFLNYIANMVVKEIDPMGTKYPSVWRNLEIAFNTVFAVELLINMYGHWFFRFWSRCWNIFDFAIVAVGTLDMIFDELPPQLTMLRMMRAFRVFRLFAKIDSLSKVALSLVHAIPGVVNAFFINLVFMMIYSVVAVELFDGGGDCELPLAEREQMEGPVFQTFRGYCYGEEYFGTFSKSINTMNQVLTGESWSEVIVRPLIWSYKDSWYGFVIALYFISFIVLNSVVLLNVVVAVLVEKMTHYESTTESDRLDEYGDEDSDGWYEDEEDMVYDQANPEMSGTPSSGTSHRISSVQRSIDILKRNALHTSESMAETASGIQRMNEQLSRAYEILNTAAESSINDGKGTYPTRRLL